jgi:hypothetical protein
MVYCVELDLYSILIIGILCGGLAGTLYIIYNWIRVELYYRNLNRAIEILRKQKGADYMSEYEDWDDIERK